MGRPQKWTEERRQEILASFFSYIDEKDIPVIAEFAYLNKIPRTKIYEWPEFRDAIELCHCKKEANLELGGLARAIDSGMAKFSLAQLGWRAEKQEVNHSGSIRIIDDIK